MGINNVSKQQRVLSAFLSGHSFNRFEAETQLHDHCLHSTVSTLEHRYGFIIDRKWETVPGYLGYPTRCCRYWITPEERKRIQNQG